MTVYAGFIQEFGFSTVNTALNIPIGLQEMVLALWLIFRSGCQASLHAAPSCRLMVARVSRNGHRGNR